jgi:hypothetical protein
MQQVEEATASGNNSVSPKVNLVDKAIEFASNINPENLPIRSYDANGTLIDVQWQGEANALDTFHDDPTFRNVVSQQDSILRFSTPTEPTENDILFGRGGNINKHPGNVRFQVKALELRSWYEACNSNEEKYKVKEDFNRVTKETANEEKKKSKRVIDFSTPMKPTENDILFGRGGDINKHPGIVRFRAKAFELQPWYEACESKEEKYKISELLVDCMKAENRRFLKKGPDGSWYEVVGNGMRNKASQTLASQTLRERARF